MRVIDIILEDKKKSVELSKKNYPFEKLIDDVSKIKVNDSSITENFLTVISRKNSINIIGELKKSSPSAGILRDDFNIRELSQQMAKGGACALSVLTEEKYFMGSPEFIKTAKEASSLPVLRKDFIFDEYQIYESKYYRADAILLITSILEEKQLENFLSIAKKLNLYSIVEIHDRDELKKALDTGAEIIGINNRNLNDFTVDIRTSLKLRQYIPEDKIVISESGIRNKEDVRELFKAGINVILVGTSLMRSENIVEKLKELIP